MPDEQGSRRDVLKKAAYITPAVLTLKAIPSFASNGSGLAAQERGEKTKRRATTASEMD
jgi:hypothetical protein